MTKLTLQETPHDIWVVAELKDGTPTPLTLELTYGARMVADMMGFYVKAAVLGSGLPDVSGALIQAGADRVYVLDHPALSATGVASHAWLEALSDMFMAQSPEFVLFGATPMGEALAPRLAQRFGGGLIARCLSLRVDDFDRAFVGKRTVYGGEYYEVVATSGPAPQFATVLPDCFGPPYLDASRLGETEKVEVKVGDGSRFSRLEVVEFQMPRPKLKTARRIVSVGRQGATWRRRSSWLRQSARSLPARARRLTKVTSTSRKWSASRARACRPICTSRWAFAAIRNTHSAFKMRASSWPCIPIPTRRSSSRRMWGWWAIRR